MSARNQRREDVTVDEHIQKINQDGRRSWLVIRAARLGYDVARSPNGAPLGHGARTPADRFAFQVDGFTQLDALITPDGLRVLYNGPRARPRRSGNSDEDDAFRGERFLPGTVVRWEEMHQAVRRFVELSRLRLQRG